MLVTGVQPAGSKGVSAVQVAAVDPKDAFRVGAAADGESGRGGSTKGNGDTQPVVFPRQGVPMDQRPVSLRHHHAAARYHADGDPK